MKISIYCFFDLKDKQSEEICAEYLKRFPWKVDSYSINDKKFAELAKTEKYNKAVKFFLTETGEQFSSPLFAQKINKLGISGESEIFFFIGPPEGFDKTIKNTQKNLLSLGSMTFPHRLARILLIEQLYRAWSIIENRSYHK